MAAAISVARLQAAPSEGFPAIDLGPYLAGAPGGLERAAAALRDALENVGFYRVWWLNTNYGATFEMPEMPGPLAAEG